MPTSARARAGASLMPSPIMATRCPCFLSSSIAVTLSSGIRSARTSSTPNSAATARAVASLSPVSITIRLTPVCFNFKRASRAPGRNVSAIKMTPANCPSTATCTGVCPLSSIAVASVTPFSRSNAALPTSTARPETVAITPRPCTCSYWSGSGTVICLDVA